MGKLIFLIVFALLLGVFAAQNTAPVHLLFLHWKTSDAPLALVIILSAAAGAIVAIGVLLPGYLRGRREVRRQAERIEELQDEATGRHLDQPEDPV